jgi:hypothetical protein
MLSVPGSEEWLIALAIAVEKVLGSADDRLGLPRES